MAVRALPLLAILLLLAACDEPIDMPVDAGTDTRTTPDAGSDGGPQSFTVERSCPGSAGCEAGGDLGLEAGAARLPIAPDLSAAEVLIIDTNGNGELNEGDGDTFRDTNGNGTFDGEWIAGFGTGRGATAIHEENPPWARALVLRNGDVTLAFVALDCVGLFVDEIDLIRERVGVLVPDIDYVVVSATHDHEGRDTIGIWGASSADSGYSETYMTFLREQAAQSIAMAHASLELANVQNASFFLRDVDVSSEPGIQTDVLRYVGDNRDPFLFDDQVRVMRFVAEDGAFGDGGETISTLVNYAAHPEYQGSRNTVMSSDFAGWMRNGIEDGALGPDGEVHPGVGGTTVYINGALGVQIGPNAIHPAQWDGTAVPDEGDEAAQVVGEQLAYHVLAALDAPREELDSFPLAFRTTRFLLAVENRFYHIAFATDLFGLRELFNYDPARSVSARNQPFLRTEVAVIDMGRTQMITMPGEIDPLLFVGVEGDRAFTPEGRPVVDPDQTNPADLSMAPRTGHLLDRARDDAAAFDDVWLLGCTNDFVGYFVAPFDYELGSTPYLLEAPGDHYEETNSLGPTAWPEVARMTGELLDAEP
jgi:hypothetical protein